VIRGLTHDWSRVRTLVFGFPGVRFAREEGLVVLSRQIHVIIGERLLSRGLSETVVFGAAKQRQRVSPHFAL
jgi:hypothetical protein